MKALVLNGSPAGDNSITLQTALYIEKLNPEVSFSYLNVAQRIKSIEKDFSESRKMLLEADLIIFCYPVYTFLVPAQLQRFIELIKEKRVDLSGKYATQISTSKHFYDTTAHQFIKDNCFDLGLRYVRGLSADMQDLLGRKGQVEAESFFRFVRWNMDKGFCEEKPAAVDPPLLKIASSDVKTAYSGSRKIALVTDCESSDYRLQRMTDRFAKVFPGQVEIINLKDFPFAGGCLGCFHCASDGVCVYKDGFDSFLRENIQTADATVYAFKIRDHSMGYRFKLYDDRQFCNGHRTVTMGKPVGYIIDGNLSLEPNLRTLMEARAEVGGNFLAGIASDESDPDSEIDRLASTLYYAIENDYQPPKNFYGVGGLKIFRDLIYQMQGLMKEDHRFYKEHGFYDFPQKKKAMVAGMYLVGSMLNNEKLSKKIAPKMNEGMIMPYKAVLKRAKSKIK